MARMNSKLADTKAAKAALEEDIFNLEGKLDQAAKVHSPLLAIADLPLHSGRAYGLSFQLFCQGKSGAPTFCAWSESQGISRSLLREMRTPAPSGASHPEREL